MYPPQQKAKKANELCYICSLDPIRFPGQTLLYTLSWSAYNELDIGDEQTSLKKLSDSFPVNLVTGQWYPLLLPYKMYA